jgi:Ca2+-transporting ATPase
MSRKPRALDAPVFTTAQWVRIAVQGLIITVGALAVYQIVFGERGDAVALTMMLTTLTLYHVVLALCVRDERGTIFNRDALPHGRQLRLMGIALLLGFLATEIGFLQRILGTTSLTFDDWFVCLLVALSLLVVEEVVKFVLSRRGTQPAPGTGVQVAPQPSPQAA